MTEKVMPACSGLTAGSCLPALGSRGDGRAAPDRATSLHPTGDDQRIIWTVDDAYDSKSGSMSPTFRL